MAPVPSMSWRFTSLLGTTFFFHFSLTLSSTSHRFTSHTTADTTCKDIGIYIARLLVINRGPTYVSESNYSLGSTISKELKRDLLSRILVLDKYGVPSTETIGILNDYFEGSGVVLDILETSTPQPSGPAKVSKKFEVKFDPSIYSEEDSAASFIALVRGLAKVTMNERVSALRKLDKYFRNLEPSPVPAPPPAAPPAPPNQQISTRLDKISYGVLIQTVKESWESKQDEQSIVDLIHSLYEHLATVESAESNRKAKSIRDFLLSMPTPNVFTRIRPISIRPQPPTPLMPLASVMTAVSILIYEPKSASAADTNTHGNCKFESRTLVMTALSTIRRTRHLQTN
jgi:hypothetical protein